MLFEGGVDDVANVFGFAHVGCQTNAGATFFGYGGNGVGERGLVDVDADDFRAFFAEEASSGCADARGGTGDDGYLILEPHLCVTEPSSRIGWSEAITFLRTQNQSTRAVRSIRLIPRPDQLSRKCASLAG